MALQDHHFVDAVVSLLGTLTASPEVAKMISEITLDIMSRPEIVQVSRIVSVHRSHISITCRGQLNSFHKQLRMLSRMMK